MASPLPVFSNRTGFGKFAPLSEICVKSYPPAAASDAEEEEELSGTARISLLTKYVLSSSSPWSTETT